MPPHTDADLPPIAGYHPTTLIDWPGRLASIVFVPRCNFRCPFCHSAALLGEPRETIPLESILDHIGSRGGWIEGVVICGGEPTSWPSLGRLCLKFHEAGLKVKLDTNGSHPDCLAELIGESLVDAVAMDLKAPLDDRYRGAAGVDVDLDGIRRSIALLMGSGIEYEFRTTVCPAFIAEEEIHAMGAALAGARTWVLQRFEPKNALDPALRTVRPYDSDRMESLARIGAAYVGRCRVRGQPDLSAAPVGDR